MKKNLFKILSMIFCVAFLMVGCATVSDVFDKNGNPIYFDEVEYFQGQVAQIGDYIYYGNGYTASDGEDFNYGTAASTGYLARLDVSVRLSYDDEVDNTDWQNTSPLNIQTVLSEKLIGYQNQYMFALGSYLYFTSANTHRTSNLENDYTQVSLFRIRFNGDGFEEIDTFRHDDSSFITVQKGSDDNYYYVIKAPTADSTYNLYSIRIGSSIGETTTLVENIESAVVSDENSTDKNIIFTQNSETSLIETDTVKAVDFATGEVTTLDPGVAGTTVTLLGREGDIVFYAYTYDGTEIYIKDLANSDNYFYPTSANRFHSAETISNIETAANGYVFLSNGSLMYKTLELTRDAQPILSSDAFTDILFVDGDYVYYSNSTSIGRINVVDVLNGNQNANQTLVTMTRIISGQCGNTGDYIYFYAQLEASESDSDTSSDSDETETDTNYYMFRVDKSGDGHYELVGKTK